MTPIIKKRKHPRFPDDSPIMFSYQSDNPYCYYGAQMKNYSRGGICLLSNYSMEPGTLITIKKTSFRLISAISDAGNVDCLEILWCLKIENTPGSQYRIGAGCQAPGTAAENETAVLAELTASAERGFADLDCQAVKTAFEGAKDMAEVRTKNLATLNRFAREITSTLDLQKVLKIICGEMVQIFRARNAGIGLLNKEKTKLKLVAFHTLSDSESDATGMEIPVDRNSATIHVISSAQTIIVPDVQNNPITTSFHDIAALRNTHCLMIVPLIARSEVIGTIGLPTSDKNHVYMPSDVSLAQTIASQISGVLENARLHEKTERAKDKAEHELEIGRQIQAGFLPDKLPDIPGWEIAAHFQPARQVAGDFYDVIPLGDDQMLALIIADVCGKGVGAALFMGLFRTLLRAATLEKFGSAFFGERDALSSPGEAMIQIIDHMNNYIATTHTKPNMFASVFYGILDSTTGDLTYINCGHPKPVVIRQNSPHVELKTSGPAVGMFSDIQFRADRIRIAPKDFLFTYTDGISEAQSVSGEFFGNERLFSLLTQDHQTAEQLIGTISVSINHYILKTDQFDDVTMLAVRRKR
jgi:sigma-B regulation protein RsbU (phosphoserine phosphatase)